MQSVFISYRRDDSADYCNRLTDNLVRRFGRQSVFRDTLAIVAGSNFVMALQHAVAQCDVMLVVIGPRWLDLRDAQGQRRIDLPDDFVRYEIATALKSGKVVVPVLVGGAWPPTAAQLPPDLAALATFPPVVLRDDPYFATDFATLLARIQPQMQWRPASYGILGAAVFGLLGLLIEFLYLFGLGVPDLLRALSILGVFFVPPVTALFALVRAWRTHRQGWFGLLLSIGGLIALGIAFQANPLGSAWWVLANIIMLAALLFFGLYGSRPFADNATLPMQHPAAPFPLAFALVGWLGFILQFFTTDTPYNWFAFVSLMVVVVATFSATLCVAVPRRQWGWVSGMGIAGILVAATQACYYLLGPNLYFSTIAVAAIALLLGFACYYGWAGAGVSPAAPAMSNTNALR